jgi:hypothetical protein
MRRRKWDAKTTDMIVLEGLQGKLELVSGYCGSKQWELSGL